MPRGWLALMMLVAVATAARADEKIRKSDLPAAVRAAVDAETRGATVKGYGRERENGQTFYEVETVLSGRTRDLLFDANGRLVEVEEEIAVSSAPAAVKSALESRGKLVRFEKVTRGARVTYEGVVEKKGKKTEVAVDADGKVLSK